MAASQPRLSYSNAEHGLPRTNADKRHAVLLLLNDEEWGQWSNREIARRCSAAESSVRNYREEIEASLRKLRSEPTAKTYTNKHGQTATMQTANIGKHQLAPV